VQRPTTITRTGAACVAALAIATTSAHAHTTARPSRTSHVSPLPDHVLQSLSQRAHALHAHRRGSSAHTIFLRLCHDWRRHHHANGTVDQPLPHAVLMRLTARARRIHRAHPRRPAYPILLRLARDWRHAHSRPAADAVIPAITLAAQRYGLSPSGMIRVAQCESRLSRTATNGQYLGLFQLGSFARARYLDGSWTDAWANATAAARYARDAGGFGPWTCGYAY
jgi:hypothetical protein